MNTPHADAPGSPVHNVVHGDVGQGGKVVQAHLIENVYAITYGSRPDWVPPRAPAAPPRFNHDRPLAHIRAEVRAGGEHSTLAVVGADRPKLGGSTVCRAALRGFDEGDGSRFPGGFYVVDLRTQDRAAAVSSLLRRLGFEDRDIPSDLVAREVRLREELGTHGALAILVDNAHRFEDVLPFLSDAAGSLTLVATNRMESRFDEREPAIRDRLSLVAEFPVRVPPMSIGERVGVLALHAGLGAVEGLAAADHDMAVAIVEVLGHDLGAVREAANRIRYGRAWGEDGLRVEYEAITERKGTMLDDGLNGLTPRQRIRVAELACHPESDFGTAVAAALWHLTVDEARTFLDDLVARGFLSRAGGSEPAPRFRFVDLGRAERDRVETGPSVDVDAARTRIFTHYRDLARTVHAALSPHRWLFDAPGRRGPAPTDEEARALAETERDALRAVVLDTVAHGRHLLAFEICEAFWAHWFPKGSFSEVVDTHTALIDAAIPVDGSVDGLDPARASRLLVQRSIAYRRDREFARAEKDAVAALDLARSAEPVHDLALLTALEARGDCYREHSATGTEPDTDLRAAEEHFAESSRVAERLVPEDIRAVANSMRKLGEVRFRLGARTEARSLLERVERIWRTRLPDDLHNLARTLTARGDLEARAEDPDTAVRLWTMALELHLRIGDGRRAADLYVRRADALELREREACLEDLGEALRLYEEADAHAQATVVRGMITALEAPGSPEA